MEYFANRVEIWGDRLNDNVTIQQVQGGDVAATEEFVRENVGWMLSVSRRILKDHALAEDSAQGAFVNIFNNLNAFQGQSRLRTWMHKIVVNQALMALRKQKRLQETPIDDLMPDFDANDCRIEDRWTTFETPDRLLEQSQTKDAVLKLIDQLPQSYRIVLLLRDIEELSTSEVAEMLALSESNVKVRLHRARAALKKLLEPLLRGNKL